jgi:isopenicillin N synthase-like dioxygenase
VRIGEQNRTRIPSSRRELAITDIPITVYHSEHVSYRSVPNKHLNLTKILPPDIKLPHQRSYPVCSFQSSPRENNQSFLVMPLIYTHASPTTVSLASLQSNAVPSSTLLSAFGPDSLGIIVVTGLPLHFSQLRHRLLSYASHIASLPPDQLANLECPEAKYLVGWSCGKEKLSDNKPDTLKGSYYINCAFHNRAGADGADGANMYPDFAEYTRGNVWPSEELVRGFRETAEELIGMVIDIAVLVARGCDRYAGENLEDYTPGYLEHVVKTSTTTKARLLHYFPPPGNAAGEEEAEGELDGWCGTHLDHSCLTGLTSAMYVDEVANPPDLTKGGVELPEMEGPPDVEAGLYIKDRGGNIVKVGIPKDALAFQTGEALERITRGKFKAVPHFVRGMKVAKGVGVARNTLAVFTREYMAASCDGGNTDENGQNRIFTRRLMEMWISRLFLKRLWIRTLMRVNSYAP